MLTYRDFQSIYGDRFEDENLCVNPVVTSILHFNTTYSKLRHTGPGVLSMGLFTRKSYNTQTYVASDS